MVKRNGMNLDKFPLYIKEIECRYNTRDIDTFLLLMNYLLENTNCVFSSKYFECIKLIIVILNSQHVLID